MTNYVGADYYNPMEKEAWPDVGTTVHEQAEGKFTTSVVAKARMGVVDLDLQLGPSDQRGQSGTGSYGKEARAELKKLAELEGLNISSVHAPIMQGGINNLSGFSGQEGFKEEARAHSIEEMRKVIDFAGDIATDKKPMAITVHVGEFPRDIMETGEKVFAEKGKPQMVSVTNFESGKIISLSSDRQLNIVKMHEEEGRVVPVLQREMTVDKFKTELEELKQKFHGNHKEIIQELNKRYGAGDKDEKMNIFDENEPPQHIKPEVVFLRAHFAAEARSAFADFKRWQAEANRVEGQLTREKQRYGDNPTPPQQEHIAELEAEARWRRDTAINSQRKWMDSKQSITHFIPTKEEGLRRSGDSLGVSAIMAWEKQKERGLQKPIAIAPENFQTDAFGSHPDEMIELVESGRKAFVQRLTEKEIEDPDGKLDEHGKRMKIENPFFKKQFAGPEGKEKAEKLAEDFIKITLDTQHLGWWEDNFKRQQGESEADRRKRFNDWYLEQTKKLAEKGIIGNVHVVDGMSSIAHLPAGQGILPVAEAVSVIRDTLRAKGMEIPGMVSEGHIEGPARQITETWRATGKSVYSHVGTYNWHNDIQDLQPGSTYAPTYLFGELATHREDFTSWSEVPLE